MCSAHQEYRQIVGIKWENNTMVGLKMKTMISFNSSSEYYMTLKELYDEQITILDDVKQGKRKVSEIPINILSCVDKDDGEVFGRFVTVAKVGNQYEIRDMKDIDIPKALEKLPKISNDSESSLSDDKIMAQFIDSKSGELTRMSSREKTV